MPSPSYDDRLIAMFDSYCKEVSRNYIKDLVRKNERRGKYVSHEPVDYLLGLLGHEDAYPSLPMFSRWRWTGMPAWWKTRLYTMRCYP